jgi:hypothetical protein
MPMVAAVVSGAAPEMFVRIKAMVIIMMLFLTAASAMAERGK